ncbi:hypothetical protein LCGC14_1615620 [marine sediment metagenome]|uniref:Uncharacterized protein n=2 Tax=marine sediment metagenome TaxID=412755 RepID=A0A0F9ITT1_9ZZZZ
MSEKGVAGIDKDFFSVLLNKLGVEETVIANKDSIDVLSHKHYKAESADSCAHETASKTLSIDNYNWIPEAIKKNKKEINKYKGGKHKRTI